MTVTMVVTSCRPCLTLNKGILKFFKDPSVCDRDRDRDHGRDLQQAVPHPEHRNSILTLKFNLQRKKNPTRILRILHQGGHDINTYFLFTSLL